MLNGLHLFCAVLAWSRVRFVRSADNERADTTLALLAECFATLGGVPRVVLAERGRVAVRDRERVGPAGRSGWGVAAGDEPA